VQLGIEVERVGAPDDPVEGSNVTLICTSFSASSALTLKRYPWLIILSSASESIDPPTWFYYANRNKTWQKLSKDFLKEPNAGIKH
jgi:homoserine acetyltransferase